MLSAFCLVLGLLGRELCAQQPITFQYFYDETGQLTRVVDSTGIVIEYVYDAVGNILQVNRSTLTNPGGLSIFSFSPQQGGPLSTVTIQGQGFSTTAVNNVVRFNGVAASVISVATNSLLVTVPAGANSGPISVTVAGTTVSSSTNFTAIPLPVIASVKPISALANRTLTNFQVTGLNLGGSTFSFTPVLSPAAIAVTSSIIDPSGTSATLSLAIGATAVGTFTTVATSAIGQSDTFPSVNNQLVIIDPNSTADSDGDGFPDALEAEFGSDPFDPNSIPNFNSKGDVTSLTFSILNNVNPISTLPPSVQETTSVTFSLLNDVNPGSGQSPSLQEANSFLFSVLNDVVVAPLVSAFPFESQGKKPKGGGRAINDPGTDSLLPSLLLTVPRQGDKLIAGQTLTVTASAKDAELSEVEFSVNGVPLWRDPRAPYEFVFTVPTGVARLTFSATVKDMATNRGESDSVAVSVVADHSTTLTGQVVNGQGSVMNDVEVRAIVNGLQAEFFNVQRPLAALPDLTGHRPDKTLLLSAVNIRNPNEVFGSDPFGVGLGPDYAARLTRYLQVSKPGLYRFFLGADEGARLVVNGVTLIDMPTGQGKFQEKSGQISLNPGRVPIELTYYESVGTAELQLLYAPPGEDRQVVPPGVLISDAPMLKARTNIVGTFSIPNLPSYLEGFRVGAVAVTTNGNLTGFSEIVKPIAGGTTDVGRIVVK